ncbi:MAG: BlaI/MecI/CopY family transcriptional regulator [Bacteroidetes bacterium]|nr:MAG: BlaI/MecI/CopY family transcriptional regulator [Bacteroidota bacterium]
MHPAKTLTKAEEQVMRTLWRLESAFLKDVLDAMPPPQPHANTVATILKILIDKGFVNATTMGRNNLYAPSISREAYSAQSLSQVVGNYFEGSYKTAVSFLVEKNQLSISDLELLLEQLKEKEEK